MFKFIFIFLVTRVVYVIPEFPVRYPVTSHDAYLTYDTSDDFHSHQYNIFCNESDATPIDNFIKHKLQNWAEFSKSRLKPKILSMENQTEQVNISSKGWIYDVNMISRAFGIKDIGNISRKCIQIGLFPSKIAVAEFSVDNVTVGGKYEAKGNILNFPFKSEGNWSLNLDLECHIYKRFNLTKDYKFSHGIVVDESYCNFHNPIVRYDGLLNNVDMSSEGEKGGALIKSMVLKSIERDMGKLCFNDIFQILLGKIRSMLQMLLDHALVEDTTLFDMATFKSDEK